MTTLRTGRPATASRRLRTSLGCATLAAGVIAGAHGTQDAVANGDTRTITILHEHTKESAAVTFRRNGSYDPQALEQLNWLLRDWRLDEPTKMDPRLFDIVWQVHRTVGSSEPVRVVSAYRSPQTNAMLRRRSRRVAEHSQHMSGKAMDFYLPDVDMGRVRAEAMRLQRGGVGFYPSAYNPFVHLDAGSVRAWPRMTRDQLARLFPDGRTVHVPADGKPLPGYDEAKAEILARGGSVAGYAAYAAGEEEGPRKSLWARLFGGGDDEDTEYYRATQPGRGVLGARPRVATAPVWSGSSASSDDAGTRGLLAYAAPEPQAEAPASGRRGRRGAPQVASLQQPEPAAPALAASPAAPLPKLFWQAEPTPPVAAAAPSGEPEGDEVQPAAVAAVPLPPRRPDDFTALAVAPVPPTRPVELAAARPPSGADLEDDPEPRSPVAEPAVTASAAPRPAGSGTPAQADRLALRALFVAAASDAGPAPQARVATSRAKAAADAPAGFVAEAGTGLAMQFSKSGEIGAKGFSGPAVKPLPVLR